MSDPLPPFEQPTAAEVARAAQIVDSQPVVSAYASCEWDCLNGDGQLWVAAIVREAVRLARRDTVRALTLAAHHIAWQAGVGGRETAGALVSYLATSPDEIGPFVAGSISPVDFKGDWIRGGCLTWHAVGGDIVSPPDPTLPSGEPA